jgi:hypothetical protein
VKKPTSAVRELLRKYGEASTVAVVLTLCACTAAPGLQYPSGTAARAAVNPGVDLASAPAMTAPSTSPAPGASLEKSDILVAVTNPAQIIPITYSVNDSERSVMTFLRRWSQAANSDFSWNANIDYSVTPRMRVIQFQSYAEAVMAVQSELAGVDIPLKITLGSEGLYVSLANTAAKKAKEESKTIATRIPLPVRMAVTKAEAEPGTVTALAGASVLPGISSACNDRRGKASPCTVESGRSARGEESLARWQARQAAPAPHVRDGRRHKAASES